MKVCAAYPHLKLFVSQGSDSAFILDPVIRVTLLSRISNYLPHVFWKY